jgi:hypothetical protein
MTDLLLKARLGLALLMPKWLIRLCLIKAIAIASTGRWKGELTDILQPLTADELLARVIAS